MRLFCLPYAGGGASIYKDWAAQLPSQVDVCTVQLPGRENRIMETAFTRMGPLVERLTAEMGPALDVPFAMFGHSMGAIICFETALRLQREGKGSPAGLLLSARRAPPFPPNNDAMYDLPDGEFRERLRHLNGTPEAVLENEELMDLMLPLLRADFELDDTYRPSAGDMLHCPVTAFGALSDSEVPRDQLESWRHVTRGAFRLRMFPGDHFFIHKHRGALVNAVTEDLMRVLG